MVTCGHASVTERRHPCSPTRAWPVNGGAGEVCQARQRSAAALFLAGRWDQALGEIGTSWRRLPGVAGHYFAGLCGIRAMIAVHRGDLTAARDSVASAGRWTERGPPHRGIWMSWARGLLAEALGEGREALGHLADAWGQRGASTDLLHGHPLVGPDLVRLALGEGERQRAEASASRLEALAAANADVASVQAASLYCRGLVSGDPTLLQQAAATYLRAGRPLAEALADQEAALMLTRQGRPGPARALLERTVPLFSELGATRHLARTEAGLRALGVRRGAEGPRRRPAQGWDSLTVAERKVVALVAEGLTNPQIAERLFVSRLTVKSQVSQALAKVGLGSRVELAVLCRLRQSGAA